MRIAAVLAPMVAAVALTACGPADGAADANEREEMVELAQEAADDLLNTIPTPEEIDSSQQRGKATATADWNALSDAQVLAICDMYADMLPQDFRREITLSRYI